MISSLPSSIKDLQHILIYGSSGSGKYSQALEIIKNYNPDKNFTTRKFLIRTEKENDFYIKSSEVHYEIDLSITTIINKSTLSFIYDIIDDNSRKIILYKNFQKISQEMIEVFYSLLKKNKFVFIVLTTSISFIPTYIYNHFLLKRQSRINREQEINTDEKLKDIVEKIIKYTNKKEKNYSKCRDLIYDIYVYDINIDDFIFCFIKNLSTNHSLSFEKITSKLLSFFTRHNNNHRPYYHTEKLIYELIEFVNDI